LSYFKLCAKIKGVKSKLLTFKKGGENMKKFSKLLLSFAILSFLLVPMFALPAAAQSNPGDFGLQQVDAGLGGTLGNEDPRTVVGRIINIALGFLGVIALGIILMGGFTWMTAGGNEDKVAQAKKMIGAGVIGLAIIFLSWALANFIVGSLYNTTTGM